MRNTLAFAFACLLAAAAAAAAPRSARKVPAAPPAAPKPAPAAQTPEPGIAPMTREQARTTIRMLDDVYQITLQEVHQKFPPGTGQPVAAATVVRLVQAKMGERGWPQSRFLGVSGILMNPDHRPKDAFEHAAVEAIRDGKEWYETVEGS